MRPPPQAYRDPMLKLSIMTEQELNQIFGTLDSLIPLHEGAFRPPTPSPSSHAQRFPLWDFTPGAESAFFISPQIC